MPPPCVSLTLTAKIPAKTTETNISLEFDCTTLSPFKMDASLKAPKRTATTGPQDLLEVMATMSIGGSQEMEEEDSDNESGDGDEEEG